jgi:hypothetical protein
MKYGRMKFAPPESSAPRHPTTPMRASIVIHISATPDNLGDVLGSLARMGVEVEEPKFVRAKPALAPPNKSKARFASEADMTAYFVELGLEASDATYFWNKMLSTDWRVAGRQVRDCKATIRTWKAGSFFPSQKGTPHFGGGAFIARDQAAREIIKLRDDLKFLGNAEEGGPTRAQIYARIDTLVKQFNLT